METKSKISSGKVAVESTEHNAAMEIYNFTNMLRDRELQGFSLGRFIVHPGCRSQPDQHKVKEYWFIAAGEGTLEINGVPVQAKQGSLFFFDSFIAHMIINKSATAELEIFSIWW